MFETLNHPVFTGPEAYSKLGRYIRARSYDRVFILTDSNCRELCLPMFEQKLNTDIEYFVLEVPAGEEYKNLDTCTHLWRALLDHNAGRHSLLINLGGGVVTDTGGFVASTFKRGMDFIHVPTTLLGQVDAAFGGKTGVDLDDHKNMVGSFTHPQAVLIDTDFLRSLSKRQFISGFAEVVKYALIADAELWGTLKTMPFHELQRIEPIIERCIHLKLSFTDGDFRETGVRKALNFGHSFGHAVETLFLRDADRRTVLHGEAVAMGIICESYFNAAMGNLNSDELDEITQFVSDVFPAIEIHTEDFPAIADLMRNDKKNRNNEIFIGALSGLGSYSGELNIDGEMINRTLDHYLKTTHQNGES